MKRFLASLLTAAAVLPAFWFHVKPDGQEFCDHPSSYFVTYNHSKIYTVTESVKFVQNKNPHNEFCKTVASFPF